jgi:hypothetical protein
MGLHLHSSDGETNRRKSPRETVRLTAMLRHGGTSVACTVQNVSTTGASVLLPDSKDVPDEVTLLIIGKTIRYQARVVWRLSPLIALKFKGV